jgi:hypothetical protein
VKVSCRYLDVVVFELSGSAFRREDRAPVDVFEVPMWKCVSFFRVLAMLVIDPRMPLAVFTAAVDGSTGALNLRIHSSRTTPDTWSRISPDPPESACAAIFGCSIPQKV